MELVLSQVLSVISNHRGRIWFFLLFFFLLLLVPNLYLPFEKDICLEKRIELLSRVSEIDPNKLQENPILLQEYNSIIYEVQNYKISTFGKIFKEESTLKEKILKAFTGACSGWIAFFLCVIMYRNDPDRETIHGLYSICIFTAIVGMIYNLLVRSFYLLWINYLIIPMLIFVFLIMCALDGNVNTEE